MRLAAVVSLLVIAVCAPVASAGNEHANSVTQFSGTQGQNGWFYGYWDRTADANGVYSSAEVTMFAPSGFSGGVWTASASPPPWTAIWNNTVLPNGVDSGHEQWVVRRWICDFSGVANITGTIRKVQTGNGDGTINYIIVDNVYVLRQDLLFDDSVGTAYSINVHVHVGSVLDFVTAPGANEWSDRTRFTAHVAEIAEPVMDTGLGFSGVQNQNGWWYGWYRPATDHTAPGYQPPDFRALPANAWTGIRWYRLEEPAPRTLISYSHETPNDNSEGMGGPYWVIRRWLSDFTGDGMLSGTLQKVQVACGDGTRGVIFQNGQVIWTGDLVSNNALGLAYNFPVTVVTGDVFDFTLQDRFDDGCDITRFTATLTANPGEQTPPCAGDWDRNGLLDSADLFAFLTDFFAGAADFNHDGVTNSSDFFDFVTAFLSGCS